jgi:CheY-like chemotaxis protein
MSKHRVLVVEDEWLIARDYVSILKTNGHVTVGPAATSKSALTLLETERVDVALLDFQLGSGNSVSVVRTLNQSGIPFIVITGHSKSDLPSEFADGYIMAKPANPLHLIATLEQIVKSQP